MLDISSDVNTGAVEHAKTIGVWTVVTMVGLFLVEYPLIWLNDRKVALLDFIAESVHYGDIGLASFYSHGKIHQPSGTVDGISLNKHGLETAWNPFYTYIGVALTPSMFAIGWFMKARVAFLVNLGTIVGWFFLVPLAVFMNVPIYDATQQANIPIQDYASGGSAPLQMIAFQDRPTIAIGAIVGGGMFGLAKMWRTFANIFTDIGAAFKGDGSQEYMEGKGWYEWPLKHIPILGRDLLCDDRHLLHRRLLPALSVGLRLRSHPHDLHAGPLLFVSWVKPASSPFRERRSSCC